MENIEKHIQELDQMLKNKGYDGYFLSNQAYPDKLKDSLAAFMKAIQRGHEAGHSFPPSLSTYSFWKNEESDHIRCNFKLDYHAEKGFRVKTLEVECFNRYGSPGRKATVPIQYCSDLPERQQANALVKDHKKDGNEDRKKD